MMVRRWVQRNPNFGKLMLAELTMEIITLDVFILIFGVVSHIHDITTLTGDALKFAKDNPFRELIFLIIAVPIGSLMFRFWNQLPVCYFLRCYTAKRLGHFSMINMIYITIPVYVLFYTVIAQRELLIELWNPQWMSKEHLMTSLLWAIGIGVVACAAALIAPLLTYRLTGYVLECDFRLPPWSHGKWGFGKPSGPAHAGNGKTQ